MGVAQPLVLSKSPLCVKTPSCEEQCLTCSGLKLYLTLCSSHCRNLQMCDSRISQFSHMETTKDAMHLTDAANFGQKKHSF